MVPWPSADELRQHEAMLDLIHKASGGKTVWREAGATDGVERTSHRSTVGSVVSSLPDCKIAAAICAQVLKEYGKIMELSMKGCRIGVVGLGYVGLPLAVEFGKQFATVGFDIKAGGSMSCKTGKDRTLECSPEEIARRKSSNIRRA